MKSKLIRAKLVIETEVVIENYYNEEDQKCAESACRRNINEIISQAYESGQVKVTNVSVVTKKDQLPTHWDIACLPFLPNISFGYSKQEKTIGNFLKK